jgi:hypothetical protein
VVHHPVATIPGNDTRPASQVEVSDDLANRPKQPVSTHEAAAIRHVTDRLALRFNTLPRAHVTRIVAEAHHDLDYAPLRDFVPVLVERDAARLLEVLLAPAR